MVVDGRVARAAAEDLREECQPESAHACEERVTCPFQDMLETRERCPPICRIIVPVVTSQSWTSAECVPTASVLPLGTSPQASDVTMFPLPFVSISLCAAPLDAFHKKTLCRSATARMLDLLQSSRLR
eukprot:389118-Hanusia_phi.AAC.2